VGLEKETKKMSTLDEIKQFGRTVRVAQSILPMADHKKHLEANQVKKRLASSPSLSAAKATMKLLLNSYWDCVHQDDLAELCDLLDNIICEPVERKESVFLAPIVVVKPELRRDQ
jgi:hypothetical protein